MLVTLVTCPVPLQCGHVEKVAETIKVKEMTYFFVIIGVSAINALSNHNASLMELVVANGSILLILFILEYTIGRSSTE